MAVELQAIKVRLKMEDSRLKIEDFAENQFVIRNDQEIADCFLQFDHLRTNYFIVGGKALFE